MKLCFVLVVASMLLGACSEAPERTSSADTPSVTTDAGPPWFTESAATSGLAFEHRVARSRHYYMPETVTGGVGLLDVDGDADLDVYLVQGGDLDEVGADLGANKMFANDGAASFTDVTAEVGGGDTGYGMGCAVGDYDGDADPDLFVSNVGPNVLYRNDDGKLNDVSRTARVDHPGHGSSCAFADIDRDGDLDLFVVNYINWSKGTEIECVLGNGKRDYCSPKNYQAPAPDVLYENLGDGRFRDITEASGLREYFGNGLGVVFADFDSDGSQDIYVANDGNPNQLWINDGSGKFENRAIVWGCSVNMNGAAEAGMGVGVIDIDKNGAPDLFMTHLRGETNTFYENQGQYFRDRTAQLGLASPSRDATGFGLGFQDFDHDGVLDLYVANGRVQHNARVYDAADLYAEPDQLFRGVGDGSFDEVAPIGGTSELVVRSGRGAAFGDLDDDGDVDVVVNNSHGTATLLLNQRGGDGNWIRFRVMTRPGVHALGARVELVTDGGTQQRTVRRGYSYCASNDPRVHFGLGQASQASLRVHWPDGSTTEHGPFDAGQQHDVLAP